MASGPPDETAPTRAPAESADGRPERTPVPDAFKGTERFQVLRRLGEGGMGVVHEVFDRERKLRLALKGLQDLGARQVLRFKDEFRTLRDLQHPNLVRLGELIEDDGRWYFTMELVEGCDFLAWVSGRDGVEDSSGGNSGSSGNSGSGGQSGGAGSAGSSSGAHSGSDGTNRTRRLGRAARAEAAADAARAEASADPEVATRSSFHEARLRDALAQLASGLAFLHDAGKVHRDVKPSNVMVQRDGRVVLLDFGIAAEARESMRPSGKVIGTVRYMAPEQALGEAVGPAADWYAVGMLLYQGLTGRLPFSGGSAADVLTRKRYLQAIRPSELVDGLPADLEELCARLIVSDPARRPPAAEILAALGVSASSVAASALAASASSVFVGRQAELEVLDAALEVVRRGRGATAVVFGPSGVGKTAVVDELVRRAGATDARTLVLRGRCHERESVPYKAFDGVVDELSKFLESVSAKKAARLFPDDAGPLFRVFPSLETALPEGASPPLAAAGAAPAELRERAFAGLRELLARLAFRRPLVIVIDDVQWADLDSLDLLEALLRPPRPPPFLLALTARRGDSEPACAALGRLAGDVRHLPLGGLGGDEALALARELAARYPGAAAGALAELIRDAAGHPLFIDELVRSAGSSDGPRATTGAAGSHLDEALCARVARLPEATRGLLELVVAAGAPVPQESVARAAGLSPESYARELDVLRAGKLVRVAGVRRRDSVEPFHDRVREAIYTRLGPGRRRALHAALARQLEQAGGAPDLLAAHFERAGERAVAARYAETAAVAARTALAFDRAASLYRAAIELGDHPPEKRRALLTALGDGLANAGRPREAAESFQEAASTGDVPEGERVDLRRRATEQLVMGGHLAEGLEASRAVLEAFGEGWPASRVGALARFVWAHTRLTLRPLRWQPRRTEELPPGMLARLDMFWSIGAGLMMLDTVRGALFTTRGALAALDAGHEHSIARFLCATSMAEAVTGKAARLDRIIDACHRAASGSGAEQVRYYAFMSDYSRIFFLENAWSRTVEGMIEAERMWRASTGRLEGWEGDVIEQLRCWSLENLGSLREIRERVPARIRAAERAGNRFIAVNFRTFFVHVHLVPDHVEEARRDVADAIGSWLPGSDVFGNQDYLALRSLTYIALYAGDVDAHAAELVAGWRRYFGSLMRELRFLRQDALFLTAGLALARAVTARRRGDDGAARTLLAEARARTARLARIPTPMAADYVSLLRPGLVAFAEGPEAAVPLLREAIARADDRGTRLHAACLRRRLGETLGGDEGRALIASGDAWMLAEEIASPARLVAGTLPGWTHPG